MPKRPTLILEVEYEDEINMLEGGAELIEKAREQGAPKRAYFVNVTTSVKLPT